MATSPFSRKFFGTYDPHPSPRHRVLCVGFAARRRLAQISFTTAIDLAVKNSPKCLWPRPTSTKPGRLSSSSATLMFQLVGGSGLGPPSYGFPLGQPSIFNVTSQSLVFSYSQRDYIRARRRRSMRRTSISRIPPSVSPRTLRHLSCPRPRYPATRPRSASSKHIADRLVSIVRGASRRRPGHTYRAHDRPSDSSADPSGQAARSEDETSFRSRLTSPGSSASRCRARPRRTRACLLPPSPREIYRKRPS